jgi:hypothetical protein
MKGAERRHTSASPTEHIRWLRQGGRGRPPLPKVASLRSQALRASGSKQKFSLLFLNRLATPPNQDIFAVETKENF